MARTNHADDDTPIRASRKPILNPFFFAVAGLGAITVTLLAIGGYMLVGRAKQTVVATTEPATAHRISPARPFQSESHVAPLPRDTEIDAPRKPEVELPPIPALIAPLVPGLPKVTPAARIAKNNWWKGVSDKKIDAILERLRTASEIVLVYEPNGDFGETNVSNITSMNPSSGYLIDCWLQIFTQSVILDNIKKFDLNPPISDKTDRRFIIVKRTSSFRTAEACEVLLVESLHNLDTLNNCKKAIALGNKNIGDWIKQNSGPVSPANPALEQFDQVKLKEREDPNS